MKLFGHAGAAHQNTLGVPQNLDVHASARRERRFCRPAPVSCGSHPRTWHRVQDRLRQKADRPHGMGNQAVAGQIANVAALRIDNLITTARRSIKPTRAVSPSTILRHIWLCQNYCSRYSVCEAGRFRQSGHFDPYTEPEKFNTITRDFAVLDQQGVRP